MDQNRKKVGMGAFALAGIADGFQFLINFLNLIPIFGTIVAALLSFVITLATFLLFGILFGYWFPITFFGEMIPIINGLPFWTARILHERRKERAYTTNQNGEK